jgi:pimeloyl-ACP methyl ester carboxylesterase
MKTTALMSALLSATFAALLSGAAPAFAADAAAAPPNRFAATIAPSERFEVDGVLVEQHGKKAGSRGRPLILIPGLATGGWVWQETVRAFSDDHAVYVLTLPGFDGRPPAPAKAFASARAAVEKLVEQRRLDRPVIVGHSLGATLALGWPRTNRPRWAAWSPSTACPSCRAPKPCRRPSAAATPRA